MEELLASILENQDAKMTENNQLLLNLIEQGGKDNNTESLLEHQIELLSDIKKVLTEPIPEVKREEVKVDLSGIESSIRTLVDKINEPIKVILNIE